MSNRGRFVITILCVIVIPLLVLTFIIASCDTNKTVTPSVSTTVNSSNHLAEEVISSTIDEQNFSAEQLSHMNLVYNPYTLEVGDSLIVFPQYAKENGFCTLYLAGVNDPESIKVEGWFLIEKTVVDTGLIKLLVCNQVVDNTAVSDGQITYDGSRTVYIR